MGFVLFALLSRSWRCRPNLDRARRLFSARVTLRDTPSTMLTKWLCNIGQSASEQRPQKLKQLLFATEKWLYQPRFLQLSKRSSCMKSHRFGIERYSQRGFSWRRRALSTVYPSGWMLSVGTIAELWSPLGIVGDWCARWRRMKET